MRALLCLLVTTTLTTTALAKPSAKPARPALTAAALALLERGALLVAEDNLLVPLPQMDAKAIAPRPMPLFEPRPRRLELVRVDAAAALLVVDDNLCRLAERKLTRLVHGVAAAPAASADASTVVSVETKRTILLQRRTADGNEETARVPYRRDGQWELEQPWVSADGKTALVTVHDFTAALDAYDLLIVDLDKREVEEIHLSKSFAPGTLRQSLGDHEVLLQMFTQKGGELTVTLSETDFSIFDLKQKKIIGARPGLLPGIARPGGGAPMSLLPGPMRYSDGKRCGADRTLIYLAGKKPLIADQDGDDKILQWLDFTPDGNAIAGVIVDVRACKAIGVVARLTDDGVDVGGKKTFAWPTHGGYMRARFLRQ